MWYDIRTLEIKNWKKTIRNKKMIYGNSTETCREDMTGVIRLIIGIEGVLRMERLPLQHGMFKLIGIYVLLS